MTPGLTIMIMLPLKFQKSLPLWRLVCSLLEHGPLDILASPDIRLSSYNDISTVTHATRASLGLDSFWIWC